MKNFPERTGSKPPKTQSGRTSYFKSLTSNVKSTATNVASLVLRTRVNATEQDVSNLEHSIDGLTQVAHGRVTKNSAPATSSRAKRSSTTQRSIASSVSRRSIHWQHQADNIYGEHQDKLNRLCALQPIDIAKLEAEFNENVESINEEAERLAEDKANGSVDRISIQPRSTTLLTQWRKFLGRAVKTEENIKHKYNTARACIEHDYEKAKQSFLKGCAEQDEMHPNVLLPAPMPTFPELIEDDSSLVTPALPDARDIAWADVITGRELILFPTTKSGPIPIKLSTLSKQVASHTLSHAGLSALHGNEAFPKNHPSNQAMDAAKLAPKYVDDDDSSDTGDDVSDADDDLSDENDPVCNTSKRADNTSSGLTKGILATSVKEVLPSMTELGNTLGNAISMEGQDHSGQEHSNSDDDLEAHAMFNAKRR